MSKTSKNDKGDSKYGRKEAWRKQAAALVAPPKGAVVRVEVVRVVKAEADRS